MPRREPLLGFLVGDDNGTPAKIAIYKAGRTYRLEYGGKRHLCHPSVRSIEDARRETFLVFHIRADRFESV